MNCEHDCDCVENLRHHFAQLEKEQSRAIESRGMIVMRSDALQKEVYELRETVAALRHRFAVLRGDRDLAGNLSPQEKDSYPGSLRDALAELAELRALCDDTAKQRDAYRRGYRHLVEQTCSMYDSIDEDI